MLITRTLYRSHRTYGATALRQLSTSAKAVDGLLYNGTTYPFRWLRDSCQCPECVHPSTRQKLHRTTDVPKDVHPATDGVRYSDSAVEITWSSGHRSSFPFRFLTAYGSPSSLHTFHHDVDPLSWDKQHLSSMNDLFVRYDDLQKPSGLLAAITQLTRYGVLFVTGVSNKETSNETCEARKLAESLGEIRSTMYGDLWDVVNIRNSTNIAYTNLYLGLHMDLMYFHHPPRFQLLHCLRNRVLGGTSVFVDALHAAERLRASHPSDFRILSTTPVPFHYINNGNHLHHSHPTIELDQCYTGDAIQAPIKYINYSPPFQAPLPPSTPTEFYSALERFVAYLDDPSSQFEYTLREGDAVLFDNRRVLHARTAFQDPAESEATVSVDDTTSRWLKGCYIEADTVLSRGRVLREKLHPE